MKDAVTDRMELRSKKKPGTWRDLNPQPLCNETYALPLCHNHFPGLKVIEAQKYLFFHPVNASALQIENI